MPKIWKICSQNPKLQAQLSDALEVHPIVAQLLINREITDVKEARDFLSADLASLHDPYLLKNMDLAVARIKRAKQNNEKILIAGDYDVDGVTSSVLLNKVLRQMGIAVAHYIPHRIKDGYGLNANVSQMARDEGAKLVVAVDCGITARDEVALINQAGVDVIILDHHEPDEGRLPQAVAIINPKQKDCPYPFKHLASVGLVTKLTQALLGRDQGEHVLDLAAIGTVADVVPLQGENRILVKSGLPRISKTSNKGLQALLELTQIRNKVLTPFHIGFIIGPRINAAGRMDSARTSLDLFLSETDEDACRLAQSLDRHNVRRQAMQKNIIEEALTLVEQETNFKDQKVIVLGKEGWHRGVLGIVASHLTEKYYRPAIVIAVEDGIGTASGRSIDGFHLHEALTSCAEYLEQYGGHAGAAGLTIKAENIDPFRDLINKIAQDTMELKKLVPALMIDCEIALSNISLQLAEIVDQMAPFGEGNPAPVFCTRRVTVKSRPVLLGKNTLKFWVSEGECALSAVGFGMGNYQGMIAVGQSIDIAYEISIDDWNKAPVPQLKLKDIRLAE